VTHPRVFTRNRQVTVWQGGGMPLRLSEPHLQSVRNWSGSYDVEYAGGMKTTTKTADQVRVPKVAPGEAVIITRHGEPISAVVTIEDYRLIELLRAAIPQHAAPAISEAAVAAWVDDDELTQAELDSIGREGSWQ
jgi:prevent-host-death family protein